MSEVVCFNMSMRYIMKVGELLCCAVIFMVVFAAGAKADNPNPDWVLVFRDEFSTSSFELWATFIIADITLYEIYQFTCLLY